MNKENTRKPTIQLFLAVVQESCYLFVISPAEWNLYQLAPTVEDRMVFACYSVILSSDCCHCNSNLYHIHERSHLVIRLEPSRFQLEFPILPIFPSRHQIVAKNTIRFDYTRFSSLGLNRTGQRAMCRSTEDSCRPTKISTATELLLSQLKRAMWSIYSAHEQWSVNHSVVVDIAAGLQLSSVERHIARRKPEHIPITSVTERRSIWYSTTRNQRESF
jgi:hypothetical protein